MLTAFGELAIFTGNAHPELAKHICEYLKVPLGKSDVFKFSNDNTFVRIMDNVRQRDVFIIQPTVTPVNDNIMEMLIFIDAAKRASAGRITAVLPYYSYARTDKKDQPRVPITGRLVADLIETAGANRVLTVDLHAGQVQGFFSVPVDELTSLPKLVKYFQDKKLKEPVVVATDIGISKRARDFAARIDAPLAIIEKRRVGNREMAESLNIIGDVAGMPAILFDDEINTGGSMIAAASILKKEGATDIYACATHAILPGEASHKLSAVPEIKEIVVTDTIPVPQSKITPKIKVLTVADMLGEAIYRIHNGLSVGALFSQQP
ncbi:MAG: ribose-phosphate pyrophosphokinase [Dehalococcoidia bacterium]|nr:ribose-phosphate pyrophosphokinase [Dehalococcoidia bacterium]MSQ34237.1 ribose-phosphate pyrophosphokinase [Dehalococcoidia bacterium]